jgi:hypothetical protein
LPRDRVKLDPFIPLVDHFASSFGGCRRPRQQRFSLSGEGGRVNPLTRDIAVLAESISGLARRAVTDYTPLVDAIVSHRSTDIHQIEHTLDGLLDFCFNPEALLLYKKLCRHYYFIDSVAAADYVRAYREMWDSEPEAQA